MSFIFRLIMFLDLIFLKYVKKIFKFIADVYTGTGIRKIKGYVSDVPEEEILRKREEYWTSRVEGDQEIWNVLKMCCGDDTSDGK